MPRLVTPVVWGAALVVVALFLREPVAPLFWIVAILSGAYWFSQFSSAEPCERIPVASHLAGLVLVLATSIAARLYRIGELPLGPYVDELVILARTLQVSESQFDLFGHTPLMREGWVETPNLYLYFNSLVLSVFGVNQVALKLFSVIPGVAACIGVYCLSTRIFSWKVALWTALLFATSHWAVRLSRYGWDVSFMVMAFSIVLALLASGLRRSSLFLFYAAGVVAGISLFSYVAARIAVLSILIFLSIEMIVLRSRLAAMFMAAFAIGLFTSAFPLLCYYSGHPNAFWVRARELSVFSNPEPAHTLVDNVWRHALMFHEHGSYYARDNIPGLAMMDPITGAIFLVGLVVMLKNLRSRESRLISCALFLNFLPGVLTVSQEGAPYVYRVASLMVPAFIVVGYGVQAFETVTERSSKGARKRNAWSAGLVGLLVISMLTNLFLYFGLEPTNSAAMRTMAYEQQLLGAEIARDNMQTLIVGTRTIDKIEKNSRAGEIHPERNPATVLPLPFSAFAIVALSGRYDLNRTLKENIDSPRGLRFVSESESLPAMLADGQGAKILFHAGDQGLASTVRALSPIAPLRYLRDIHGIPIFGVAIVNGGRDGTGAPP